MFSKEREMVELGSHSYNIKEGGFGGWDHINSLSKEERIILTKIRSMNQKKKELWEKDPERREIFCKKQSLNSLGSGNSQFNKYWICNTETKELRRIKSDEDIPNGWVRGKIGKIKKTCWVNNEITESLISKEYLETWKIQGFKLGRLIKSYK